MPNTTLSALPLAALASLVLLCGSACGQDAKPAPKSAEPAPAAPASDAPKNSTADKVAPADDSRFKVETVATGLEIPWAFAFTPDGRLLFTERKGRVRSLTIKDNQLKPEPLFTVGDDLRTGRGEIGLMGICVHPDFAKNKLVYIAYGSKSNKDIRVVRLKENDKGTLDMDKVIIAGFPAGDNHAGCGIKFGPDGKLYISTGEMFKRQLAQDTQSLGGKFLRLNDDGTIPSDNPFVGADGKGKDGARPELWTVGHRNPQGFDWQPGTGMMFEVEHGPSGEAGSGGDEFNMVEKGKNYGWPTIHHAMKKDGLVSPLRVWDDAIAPSSATFYSGDKFPDWKGNFFFCALGGLRGGEAEPGVFRITLDGGKVKEVERLCTTYGRLRAIAQGPDGAIYFSTSNKDGRGKPQEGDDRILRLVPKK